jgi:hypothetical protein
VRDTISVDEQVAGHKVIVTTARPADSGQRRAGCQCGWQSRTGGNEQVMPAIRDHLEAAITARSAAAGPSPQRGRRRRKLLDPRLR